jgi:hypothetical protein
MKTLSDAPSDINAAETGPTFVEGNEEMEQKIEQSVREVGENALKYQDHKKFRRFSNDIF